MWISFILFLLFCLIAGSAIAAGYVAFITLLGVFDKLTTKFKSGKYSYYIETAIILGVTAGNLFYLLQLNLPFGIYGYVIFSLFGGIFTGCLAGALAETLDIFPIISRRFNIRNSLPYALAAAALGKAFGSIIYLYILK